MANRRMIYQDFFEDDYFGTKEYGMRLLWIGLIAAAADDQGRILDNTSLIRSKVFMYDDTSNDDVDNWLSILATDGKIVRYVADNKRLIQITKWWEYQTPSWASESKYPAPPNWTDRIKCHIAGGDIQIVNWDKDGGLHNPLSNTLPNQQDRPLNDDDIKDDDDDDSDSEFKIDEHEIQLVNAFSEITKIGLPENPSIYAKWLTEAGEWQKLGVTYDIIEQAYQTAIEKEYTIVRPQGLTNFIRGVIKNGNQQQDITKLLEEVWND